MKKDKKDPLQRTNCRNMQLIMKLKTFFILETPKQLNLQLTFPLISNFFSKKTIWITIFEFQFTFSTKNENGGSLLLSEVRFEPRVYHTKFRNTSTEAQAVTGGRLDKGGWIESHNYHKRLIKYRKPSTLITGDSITKGLRR